jgi:hypothetical protein
MKYSTGKTIKKAAVPLIFIVLVRAVLAAAEQAGITLDENTVWTALGAGYAGLMALINWIKNRMKKE